VSKWQEMLEDVAAVSAGSYATGFKLLGVVVFIEDEGIEPLLSGEMVSTRTAYRWLETIREAGWGALISEARVIQAIQDHLASLPREEASRARQSLTRLVDVALSFQGEAS
jgi:hypothetical protein